MAVFVSTAVVIDQIYPGQYQLLSTHKKAINFINSKNQVISLHPNIRVCSPFGVVLRADDFYFIQSYFLNGVTLNVYDDRIEFDCHVILFKRNLTFKLDSFPLDEHGLLVFNSERLNGFEKTNDESIINNIKPVSIFRQFILFPNDFTANALISCIGLGKGLTPSFDDMLVGFLSIIYATGNESDYLVFIRSQLNKTCLEEKTTSISKSFIENAIEGRFSYQMYKLFLSVRNKKNISREIDGFLSYGHTSGIDVLLGIKLTLLTIIKK